jgi:adenylate kinase family enzyme
MQQPKRIIIFGCPGGGKTTFSNKLAKALGLPLHHIDRFFYESNWREREYEAYLADLRAILVQESWIIDGNSFKSLLKRWAHADVAIYFKKPLWMCYLRVLKRYVFRSRKVAHADRADGCKEVIWWKLITFMWNIDSYVEPRVKEGLATYPAVRLYVVRTDQEVAELLKALAPQKESF